MSVQNKTISLVLPCYNEAEGIRVLLESLPGYIDEVVVADNRSTDGTGDVARSLGAKVVYESTRGYGAAYKTGLAAATGEIITTADGDGTYPLDEIEGLVRLLDDGGYDFISASRFPLRNPAAMELTNKIGNRALTVAVRALFGHHLADSQSGMWVFRSAVLEKLTLTSNGMPFSEEIKLEALDHPDVRFHEGHISYDLRIGEVKLRRWREGLENLLFLVRRRLGRGRP